MTDEFKNEPRKLDAPFSLFDGLGGAICFLIDLMDPDKADFPLIPVFDADPEIINPPVIKIDENSKKDDDKDDQDEDDYNDMRDSEINKK